MRFSALFQSRPSRPTPEGERLAAQAVPAPGAPAAPATPDLPEDLDARVRLLGEWQVSEY